MSKVTAPCLDCRVDTLRNGEWYMVKDEVWPLPKHLKEVFLCIGCIESRIGRRLSQEDFYLCPGMAIWTFSKRLEERFDRSVAEWEFGRSEGRKKLLSMAKDPNIHSIDTDQYKKLMWEGLS